MKTLNKVALSISMLLSLPAFAVTGPSASEGQNEPKKGFFVKASEKAQAFAKTAKANFLDVYDAVKPKVEARYNSARTTVQTHPKASAGLAVATVALPVVGYKLYKAYVANNQTTAKAELLDAVKNNKDVTKAFNKLNTANKAAVQSAFNAYNKAQNQLKNAPTPKMKRRAQNAVNKARTAFVNAINAIKAKSTKDKAKALYATAKAKTKSAFATAKELAKTSFAKVKEHKKKAIAALTAALVAAYEGVNYKWFKKNPATLTRGFQKAKAAWNKRNRNDEPVVEDLTDLFATNKMGGYSDGTAE